MNSRRRRLENQNPGRSSVYPLPPPESRLLFRIPEGELSTLDRCLVAGTSLAIVGSCVWVPLVYAWALRKYKSIPATDKKRRKVCAGLVVASLALLLVRPQGSARFGDLLRVRRWFLWSSWLKFIAMEVRADQTRNADTSTGKFDMRSDQAILAFVPHGIFPFAFAFGCLPEIAQKAFGIFRPVVATATNFFPIVNDFLLWMKKVDASKESVNLALSRGDRLGIVPGGISEIFEGYPKPGTHPDEEYSIVRKGFLRLALQHGIPVIPIYCFGSTKMFRRLHFSVLEKLSHWIRASIVVLYGIWGLPVPFRQRLLYVIGDPIHPAAAVSDQAVDEMHQRFCDELLRIFDRNKDSYGWHHKTLKLLTR